MDERARRSTAPLPTKTTMNHTDTHAELQVTALPPLQTRLIGGYRLVREIGRGSFGVVYEAEQELLRRRVAVKVLKPEIVLVPTVAERFLREARLTSALSHQNAATIYGVGLYAPTPDAQGLPFIAMELLQGTSLQDLLDARGPLPPAEAIQLLRNLLAPLREAHSLGIIHRDLKPENIWLHEDGGQRTLKVLDFGIAKARGASWDEQTSRALTLAEHPFGTPAFMPPEQATAAAQVTPAADLYAVGCIAWLMLTGQLPYQASNAAQMIVAHISKPLPHLPGHLHGSPHEALHRRALAQRPEDRFQSAQDMIDALDALGATLPHLASAARPLTRSSGELPCVRSTHPTHPTPHKTPVPPPATTRPTRPTEPQPVSAQRSDDPSANRANRAIVCTSALCALLMILGALLAVFA